MSKKVKNLEHAEAAPIEELEELKAFWSKYGNYICLGLLVVVAVFYYLKWNNNKKLEDSIAAQTQLLNATTVQDLNAIVSEDRSSSVTPIAMLKAGALHFENKEYDAAIATFNSFVEKYDDHIFVPNAKFALATTYEVVGKFDEALALYEELANNDVYTSDAKLGKARCLIFKGDKVNGNAVLDMLIADNAGKPIVVRAEAIKSSIDSFVNPTVAAVDVAATLFDTPVAETAPAVEAAPAAPAEAEAPAAE